MIPKDRIAKALSVLLGLPLWGATRALNMEMFAFGERRTRRNRKEEDVEVGEYMLHIQCPWRLVGPNGIIVGSEDRNYPEDENADWREFNSDGPSRCEARLGTWFKECATAPLKVGRLEADSVGGFRLLLERGFVLEVFPANSLEGEYSERWRLFQPSQGSHFVITGYGVEE